MAKPKVIIVAKRTALDRYHDEGEDPRVRRLLRKADPSVRRWQPAHAAHIATLALVQKTLQRLGAEVWTVHGAGGRFDGKGVALVVTVGGDGTLLAASHNVSDIPLLGVNSSPKHSVGYFCAAQRSNVEQLLERALRGGLRAVALSRMRVDVDGRHVSNRVLNEALFCHAIPAATSRYILRFGRQAEEQTSSGVWIGTAAGSTGALRSAGGRVRALTSRGLQCVVREPYAGAGRLYELRRLDIPEGSTLRVQSKIQDACLFLDGPFKRVRVALGETMTFRVSDEPLLVLGINAARKRKRDDDR
ncbi:MAG TPA: NAD(+)/NADH kinase [Polyangiaceae bacterium]|jgi:NAD+ kinase|nr:NAD(+)/NADH kinase [Polyangiaceae bacterium]